MISNDVIALDYARTGMIFFWWAEIIKYRSSTVKNIFAEVSLNV